MQAYRASGPMLLIIPFLHINTLSLLFVYLMAWDECMVLVGLPKSCECPFESIDVVPFPTVLGVGLSPTRQN